MAGEARRCYQWMSAPHTSGDVPPASEETKDVSETAALAASSEGTYAVFLSNNFGVESLVGVFHMSTLR